MLYPQRSNNAIRRVESDTVGSSPSGIPGRLKFSASVTKNPGRISVCTAVRAAATPRVAPIPRARTVARTA